MEHDEKRVEVGAGVFSKILAVIESFCGDIFQMANAAKGKRNAERVYFKISAYADAQNTELITEIKRPLRLAGIQVADEDFYKVSSALWQAIADGVHVRDVTIGRKEQDERVIQIVSSPYSRAEEG